MEAHELDLLIFGDSWARDAALDTWPELLARRLRWRSANFAVPYSGSADLQRQLRRLHSRLEQSEEACSLDCVAIVHTGGNDLFHASPAALAAVCGQLISRPHASCEYHTARSRRGLQLRSSTGTTGLR